jgi:hypothetical protein
VNRDVLRLVLAALAAVGAVFSWLGAQSVVEVAPILGGQPATTSVVYDPPLLALSLVLVAVAGVLVVLGVAGWRRRSHKVDPVAYTP